MLQTRSTAQPFWHCSLGTGTHPFAHWQMYALVTIHLVAGCNYTCVNVSICTYIRHYSLLESKTEVYSCTCILVFCIPKYLVSIYQVLVIHTGVSTQHVPVPESLCDQPKPKYFLTKLLLSQCLVTRNSLLLEMVARTISLCKTGSLPQWSSLSILAHSQAALRKESAIRGPRY